MARSILILAAALLLTACNAVVSEKALFRSGGPPLKPGLWAMLESADCAFDPAKPPSQWPECAGKAVFDGRHMRNPEGDERFRYTFAKGTPRILQLEMTNDDPDERPRSLFFYLAMEPQAGRGPVTAATAWLVQCGPPPTSEEPARPGTPPGLTDRPLPGLEIKDKTCFADRADEVRNAAGPSRAWGDLMRFVYVGPAPAPPPRP